MGSQGAGSSLCFEDDVVNDGREEAAEVGHEFCPPFSSMHRQRGARSVAKRYPRARARRSALVGNLFTWAAALDAPLVLDPHAARDDLPVVRADHDVTIAFDRVRVPLGLESHRDLPGEACLVHLLGLVQLGEQVLVNFLPQRSSPAHEVGVERVRSCCHAHLDPFYLRIERFKSPACVSIKAVLRVVEGSLYGLDITCVLVLSASRAVSGRRQGHSGDQGGVGSFAAVFG